MRPGGIQCGQINPLVSLMAIQMCFEVKACVRVDYVLEAGYGLLFKLQKKSVFDMIDLLRV